MTTPERCPRTAPCQRGPPRRRGQVTEGVRLLTFLVAAHQTDDALQVARADCVQALLQRGATWQPGSPPVSVGAHKRLLDCQGM